LNYHFCATTQARELLNSCGDLSQTQIFAKIENEEVSEMHLFCLYMFPLQLFCDGAVLLFIFTDVYLILGTNPL